MSVLCSQYELGYPSAYSIASEWGQYVEAVTQDRAGVHVAKEDFGVGKSIIVGIV
jgi:hypothetical protein